MSKSQIPKSAITERDLRKMIKKVSRGSASLSAWAVENEISPQQVSAFFRKVQGAGLRIPEHLGYRPQTIYIPLKAELISTMNPPRRTAKNPSKKVDHSLDPIEKRGLKPQDDRKETKKRLKKRKK